MLVLDIIPDFRLDIIPLDTIPFSPKLLVWCHANKFRAMTWTNKVLSYEV